MGFFRKMLGGGEKPAPAATASPESEILEGRRRDVYARLGELHPDVISRLVPGPVPWPDSMLGKLLAVRRAQDTLLLTSGLSNFYDGALHPKVPPAPLDYELVLTISNRDKAAANAAALAQSWFPSLLLPLGDFVTHQWVDLCGMLKKFGMVTLPGPAITPQADALADDNGMVGYLVGLPLVGTDVDQQLYVRGFYRDLGRGLEEATMGIFSVKPLTRDEYAWAQAQGNGGGVKLAEAFIRRGDVGAHWTGRPSVLEQPTL